MAYQNKNVPTLIPNGVRERRQIEIQNLNSSIYKQSKEKIKKQNQHLDDIGLNVNKAKVYVKETQHMLSKQNDQLEYIQQNVRIFFNFF